MNGFAIVILLGTVFGLEFFWPMKAITPADRDSTVEVAIARNLGLYEEAAKAYSRDNLTFVGTFSDADLAAHFPSGYSKLEQWVAYRDASGNILVTTAGTLSSRFPPANLARRLQDMKGKPFGIGVTKANVIVSAQNVSVSLSATGWTLPDDRIAVLTSVTAPNAASAKAPGG
jgi:hypothetical protein